VLIVTSVGIGFYNVPKGHAVPQDNLTFYEFFAGGGMARAGLGDAWRCTFANDFSPAKAAAYIANWGDDDFVLADIAALSSTQLPGQAVLAWASFPCQDLSLAGAYAGLGENGSPVITRSGTFWHFWSLITHLNRERRAPCTIVLENVFGVLTSRSGADFKAICDALAEGGYRFGAVVVDAKFFVPQSRPRVFFIAVHESHAVPNHLLSDASATWHPASLTRAHSRLQGRTREQWLWWNLPNPPKRIVQLADLIEATPPDVSCRTAAETERLMSMMSEANLKKIKNAAGNQGITIGTVYRRTRPDEYGVKRQRAEVRFDGIAGCLRTPGGGSSRQTIVLVEDGKVRSRLLSSREAARLMGLPESYKMPTRYNEAYRLAGDGVCVDVVRFLAANLLEPLSGAAKGNLSIAAE
jgi:DNA (cytosine-5)-methyltransferase 1